MTTYLVDFELSLFQSLQVEAADAEEARSQCEELLGNEDFWKCLCMRYKNPTKTDWLPENVTVSVYGEVEGGSTGA